MSTIFASTVKAVAEFTSNACGPDPVSNPLGDLDNPIHPLFSHANFRVEEYTTKGGGDYPTSLAKISTTAYEGLTPALRLASLLITVPSMFSPFDHLCNGNVVGERTEKCNAYIARGPREGEPLGLEAVKDTFDFMKTRVQFQFVQPDSSGAIGRTVFVRLYDDLVAQTGAKSIERGLLASDQTLFHIMCEGQAYVGLCRSGWLRYFEQEVTRDGSAYQLNALLDFTHTLMHEVVHAFFLFVDTEYLHASDLLREEPRYNEHSEPELGWTYQNWLCGRLYEPIRIPRHLHGQKKNIGEMPGTELNPYCAGCGGQNPAVARACRVCCAGQTRVAILHQEESFMPIVLFHEANTELVCIGDHLGMRFRLIPKGNILTAQLVQSWFLRSTWQKIENLGHDFIVREAAQTQINYLGTKPKWSSKSGWSAVQLISHGKVYATLKIVAPGDERVADTTT